jgi:hypothetical protein
MEGDDRTFAMIPLERTLFVEGRSRDRKVGEFRGVVLAIGWWSAGEAPSRRAWGETPPPTPLYLVSDRNKPSPVWVAAAELEAQDWISAFGAVPPPPPRAEEDGGGEPVGASEGEPGEHE